MRNISSSKQPFPDVLDVADSHGLDEDEVLKSQWLLSNQGTSEINILLPKIKDTNFVLSECLTKGQTEDAVRALLFYGLRITDQYKSKELEDADSSCIWNLWKARLQLLQSMDRLETFLGINMGRFSVQEYRKFLSAPLYNSAILLAEAGKIGALNLLFKRHPYSLSVSILKILSAVPETIPVESYGQLLPGISPPSNIVLRDGDWVESKKMAHLINNTLNNSEDIDIRTEVILKYCVGFIWPSVTELSEWYMDRARDIDYFTGQLDNCLCLVDFARRKGIAGVQQFYEDISYLHLLIYSSSEEVDFSMSLATWEQLSDYEKFKAMLDGTTAETVVKRLQEKALPLMRNRSNSLNGGSFLVRWLKELASDNKMDTCLAVIAEGCKDYHTDCLFRDEVESMEVTLDCIYLCSLTDQWNTLGAMLSKLPCRDQKEKPAIPEKEKTNSTAQNFQGHFDGPNFGMLNTLKKRVKIAEDHVEVGRLLAYYQVPKPMRFFQGEHLDERNVKQLLRLILSKFGRCQPARSDNDWTNMWQDMQYFQEKAFFFLDMEFILIEFCRGLLKAGKFSLARSYLKGTGKITLTTDKAENLVIQAAREYFFSASSLSCSEVWKAKECLNLFPNSDVIKAEAGIIDALTTKLPNLGVTLLPMQFRQIRNPMEVINMVIKNQSRAHLNVDELIEIAQLLGLNSPDDIASIQEAVARESAVTGDLQMAFDLCLLLSKKGHGPIWDLCAAIAKGPALENMDTSARKQLLGFSLSHCDEESIGELLYAWKDINMQDCCEKLMSETGTSPPEPIFEGSSLVSLPADGTADFGGQRMPSKDDDASYGWSDHYENIKNILLTIAKDIPSENGSGLPQILRNNRKVLSFAVQNLPWLIELSNSMESRKMSSPSENSFAVSWHMPMRMQALLCIISWMAMNDIPPKDDIIASLAKSVMETSNSEEEDVLGCSFLLNLMDGFRGVEIIEEQTMKRQDFHEVNCIMNLGVTYSSLHSAGLGCSDPDQRRLILLHKFQEKHASFCPDESDMNDKAQSAFWISWRSKLEEQKRLASQARKIEDLIPGAEASRFLSGDIEYIKDIIFSLVKSVKSNKRHILKDAIELADTYHVQRAEVLLHYLGCALVSDLWTNDEILAEVLDYKDDLVRSAKGVISLIFSFVYPQIDGRNKQRLSHVYSILSACYLHLKQAEEPMIMMNEYTKNLKTIDIIQFYKLLEQECQRVSFIEELNFKKIAGLLDLDFEHFNDEVCNHIFEYSVLALSQMVQNLQRVYGDSIDRGLLSLQSVYKHHLLNNLETLDAKRQRCMNLGDFQEFARELEVNYESCRFYIRVLLEADILNTIGRYCTLRLPHHSAGSQSDESSKTSLVTLLDFWIKAAGDIRDFLDGEVHSNLFNSSQGERLSTCLQALRRLIMTDEVSGEQGWSTVSAYANLNLPSGLVSDISSLHKAMAFSGCYFNAIFEIFSKLDPRTGGISEFYVNTIDAVLLKLDGNNDDCRNLLNMLSSLSKLQLTDEKVINVVRDGVWKRLIAHSENLQLSNHSRMFALQMMEAISGKSTKNFPVDLVSYAKPWEGWEGSCTETDATHSPGDVFSRVTSTLVALKSTQLSAAISPMLEITAEDLKTIDSAICCFLRLSEFSTSEVHLNILQAILGEWEGLLIDGKDAKCDDTIEENNDWSDGWDEGWDNLSEESTTRERKEITLSVHPFHTCWMEIITKLLGLSLFKDVIRLFDQSLSKSQGILLSETEAESLFQRAVGVDCFMGLKIVLLLPYRNLWFQALGIVEERLANFSETAIADEELLLLLISTGILSSIATDSSYSKVFSYLCCLVGHLCRLCQENTLKHSDGGKVAKEDGLSFYGRVLLPLFVSELSKAGQLFLAGLIVSQWMHTHRSFSFINVVDHSLRTYLEAQHRTPHHVECPEGLGACKCLAFTASILRGKFVDSIQSALSIISSSMK